jgi:hypothetical protein
MKPWMHPTWWRLMFHLINTHGHEIKRFSTTEKIILNSCDKCWKILGRPVPTLAERGEMITRVRES